MPSIKEEIAKSLQYYRKKSNLTQKELAEKIGVKHNSISSWENGINSIDIDTLFHICDVLNVRISDMYGGFAESTNPNYSIFEHRIIKKVRLLNKDGQEKLDTYIDDLLDTHKYQAIGEDGMTASERERCDAIGKEMGQLAREVIQSAFQKKGG